MTDVAGPLTPPGRFSSLPIRGADAARRGGADESGLEVSCSMAQAFEVPTENRKNDQVMFLLPEPSRVPRPEFRIAVPRPTHHPDHSPLNMGPPPAPPNPAN